MSIISVSGSVGQAGRLGNAKRDLEWCMLMTRPTGRPRNVTAVQDEGASVMATGEDLGRRT